LRGAAFEALAHGRLDRAATASYSDPLDAISASVQHVDVRTDALTDSVTEFGTTYTNSRSHATFFADSASLTGSYITDPSQAIYIPGRSSRHGEPRGGRRPLHFLRARRLSGVLWLERAGISLQLSRDASFSLAVRRIIQPPTTFLSLLNPPIAAANVTAAFHLLRGNNELFIVIRRRKHTYYDAGTDRSFDTLLRRRQG